VTAGAPGDLPLVLRRLVERNVAGALVAGIDDPPAVRQCSQAGAGKTLRLSIGAGVETRFGPPFTAEALVVRLVENAAIAIVRIGGVEAVLGQACFTDPGQFKACGLDPLKYKIVVVKEGYLFPGLAGIAPRHIMLLTPGAGDMRIERLVYARRRRPVFPFEPETTFGETPNPKFEIPRKRKRS
jgi:microcystin degradation protein MlrC